MININLKLAWQPKLTSQIIPNLYQEKLYDQCDIDGMQMVVALQTFDGRSFIS